MTRATARKSVNPASRAEIENDDRIHLPHPMPPKEVQA